MEVNFIQQGTYVVTITDNKGLLGSASVKPITDIILLVASNSRFYVR